MNDRKFTILLQIVIYARAYISILRSETINLVSEYYHWKAGFKPALKLLMSFEIYHAPTPIMGEVFLGLFEKECPAIRESNNYPIGSNLIVPLS